MKHVFLLLLAVNIGLFIWGYQREQASEYKRPRSHDVGELRLLTERKAALKSAPQQGLASVQELAQITEDKVQAPVEIAVSEPVASVGKSESEEKTVEQSSSLEKSEHGSSQIAQLKEEDLDQDGDQTAVASVNDALTSNLPEMESKQQVELGPIVKIGQELKTEMIVEPELLAPKKSCYRLGPFLEIASVEGASSQLMQYGLTTAMRKQQVKKTKGYWVMYPAQASYEQAKEKLQEMKKMGLSDLWLFPKGEHKNAISLGLYSRRVNAEAANKRAQKKGVTAEVLVRYVTFDQYWLEFQDTESLSISEEARLALQKAYPNEEFEFKRCSDIVTE